LIETYLILRISFHPATMRSMSIGKKIRLNRLFSHPSGRLASVAVDHFFMYGFEKLPPSLRTIGATLERLVAARPDSITMHKGIAASAWAPYAGRVPFILQSTLARMEGSPEQIADVEDAIRLGADAFACCALLRGDGEIQQLRVVSDCVRKAAAYEMPVVMHVYPRVWETGGGKPTVSYDPDHIAWAVRCALECGADVIKVPFCRDAKAYAQIVSETPVPIVAAGGPVSGSFESALTMLQDVVRSGARGAVVGRNVWSAPDPTAALTAVKHVLHDGLSPADALARAELSADATPARRR
jgi:class I fructose-bisphosphate aldolase